MKRVDRDWNILRKEKKNDALHAIISYFKNERDEDIGVIAAENLLDMFLDNAGKHIYNKAVEDMLDLMKKRFEDIEFDIGALQRK